MNGKGMYKANIIYGGKRWERDLEERGGKWVGKAAFPIPFRPRQGLALAQWHADWWSGVGNGGGKSGLFPANYVQIIESDEGENTVPVVSEEQSAPELEASELPPLLPAGVVAPSAPPAPAASEGTVAIAAYDYEAAEDNEISFREGERITQIEKASDDWWEGKNAAGRVGLFPAAYVQLGE